MSGRPGYLRVWTSTLRIIWRWAFRRQPFWWLVLGLPVLAWILPGQASTPPLPLAASMAACCIPSAFLAGWPSSAERRHLALILLPSPAGRLGLLIPELVPPILAGAVVSAGLTAIWGGMSGGIPWQLWTLIPFTAATSAALVIILEKSLPFSGCIIFALWSMAQAVAAPWAGSGVFQLMVLPGYPLWTMRWSSGAGAGFHGDVYLFFGVLECVGLLFLAVRLLSSGSSKAKES